MTYVSVGHITQTPAQRVGSGNQKPDPWPPGKKTRALPTELPLILRQRKEEETYTKKTE